MHGISRETFQGQNKLTYQPNSSRSYPSVVFECAVNQESLTKLLDDADEKYFHSNSSVQVWIGLKLRLGNGTGPKFWIGWGQSGDLGHGLNLREQTEDNRGQATTLDMNTHPGQPLTAHLTIPSSLIFFGVSTPQAASINFKIDRRSSSA
jgi:hypothetical protein